MGQPLVRACLVRLVGEMTGTLRVWDFETLEDLEYSIVEIPKGSKAGAMWQAYGTSGVWDSETSHA
jgi:hypothetical protein